MIQNLKSSPERLFRHFPPPFHPRIPHCPPLSPRAGGMGPDGFLIRSKGFRKVFLARVVLSEMLGSSGTHSDSDRVKLALAMG